MIITNINIVKIDKREQNRRIEPIELPRTSPENQGISSTAVLRLVEALERRVNEMHSFMLLRHGSVVAEGWWAPYRSEYPHQLFSLSKSFTATAVGLAVAEGLFSIDDPLLAFFPQEMAALGASDFLPELRVRHLLSMTTGQAADTWANMVGRPDGDWIKGFFEVPLRHAPGTHFLYNTGASYLLSAIVQKTSGMKLNDYLAPRLYALLGIQAADWTESPQGITTGGIGLSLRTEDVARFGQLYLQKGMWQGKRLLSEAWVAEATTSQVSNGADAASDWAQGYGYQFWRCRHGAYRGDGVFGQFCVVMPEQDAVFVMTGGVDLLDMQLPLDLLWAILLPAMQAGALAGDAPVDDAPVGDAPARQALAAKCAGLALPPVQGIAPPKVAPPNLATVSGQTYRVNANELGIASLGLDFTPSGCTLRIGAAAGEETIPGGYGVWQRGQTRVFNTARQNGQPGIFQTRVFASGAWTSADSFTLVVRLVETPFYYTCVFYFAGDELLVECRINTSLEGPKTVLLTARALP